jgi:hypothetical protein
MCRFPPPLRSVRPGYDPSCRNDTWVHPAHVVHYTPSTAGHILHATVHRPPRGMCFRYHYHLSHLRILFYMVQGTVGTCTFQFDTLDCTPVQALSP